MQFIKSTLIALFSLLLAGCVAELPVTERGGTCLGTPRFEAPALNACSGKSVRLALVGDVLLHGNLAWLGYEYGFYSIWSQAVPLLRDADIAIANLEGPIAPGVNLAGRRVADPGPVADGAVYTGYPRANYHPVVLTALREAGIDLVTTANNHAMDRGRIGADLTLEELDKAGIGAIGSIRSGSPRSFVTRRPSAAGVISFIGCSFSTNGIADPARQVLLCYGDRSELLALVRREADDPAVAGVVVLPHWGVEYQHAPDPRQKALARALIAAGAAAVVGAHPHVVQPFSRMPRPGGGQALVAYSLGNFVAQQNFSDAQFGAMAIVDLCRGEGRQSLVVGRAGWVGMEMKFTPSGYYLSIAPQGGGSAAEALGSRIAPGFSAQPERCGE